MRTNREEQMHEQLEALGQQIEMIRKRTEEKDEIQQIAGERITLNTSVGMVKAAFYKAPKEQAPIVFYFHGGGFCYGGYCTEDQMFDTLRNQLDVNVVSVGYKINVKYPQALMECYGAVCAMVQSEIYEFDRAQISLCGSSAGANLALAVAMLAWREEKRKKAVFRIRKLLLNYPCVDLATPPEDKWEWNDKELLQELYFAYAYADIQERTNPLVSPLYAEAEDFDPETRVLVILAENDGLNAEGKAIAKKLSDFGLYVECYQAAGMPHGYYEFAFKPIEQFLPPDVVNAAEDGSLDKMARWATETIKLFFTER